MKNLNKLLLAATLAITSMTALPPAMARQAAAAAAPDSEGEIKKVDKDTQKLTIKHGELKNVNMPGMTMAFKVQDPAMLDKVKAGDKVRFHVERAGGSYVVTAIEAAK